MTWHGTIWATDYRSIFWSVENFKLKIQKKKNADSTKFISQQRNCEVKVWRLLRITCDSVCKYLTSLHSLCEELTTNIGITWFRNRFLGATQCNNQSFASKLRTWSKSRTERRAWLKGPVLQLISLAQWSYEQYHSSNGILGGHTHRIQVKERCVVGVVVQLNQSARCLLANAHGEQTLIKGTSVRWVLLYGAPFSTVCCPHIFFHMATRGRDVCTVDL